MGRVAKAVIYALIGSLLSGLVGHRVAKYDSARNQERYRQRTREEVTRYEEYHRQLKENPGVALTETWYQTSSDPDSYVRWRVYLDSLENPNVPYTPEVLSLLLAVERTNPALRMILRHPQLDPQRLELEYRLTLEELPNARVPRRRSIDVGRDPEKDAWKLIEILSSPQAKEEWFEEVAESGVLEGRAAEWKDRLRKKIENRRAGK